MEHFQELREQAAKKLSIADHMLTMTYPMLKDPKILLAGLDNIFQSIDLGITGVLAYERTFKRIPMYPDTFEGKLVMFQQKVVTHYKIQEEYVRLAREVHELVLSHKKSDVEFMRKDKFVMSDKNFNLKTVDFEKIKKYIEKTKVFLQVLSEVKSKDDRVFN